MKLDLEEKDMLDAFNNSEMIPVQTDKKHLMDVAKNTVEQKKMINFRVSERDFRNFKVKAFELGVPYQTLLKIIIHQYSEGKLKLTV